MGASVRILRLPFGNGLHGRCVEAAACAVAAAVGYGGDPRASLTRRGGHGQRFGCEALRVGPGEKPWYLDGVQARNGGLLERRRRLLGLPDGPLLEGLSWEFRGDGALENLCSRHAVAGVGPAAFLQQQEFEFLVGSGGLLGAAVDWHGRSLRAGSSG